MLPPLHGLAWRNIGPAVAGGRTSGVAGTDADRNLYYFGGADGGVWKTTNGGLTWRSVWPQNSPGAIGAIAIDPRNRDTVWVGTGEPNLRNDVSYGDGIWVTHDGGRRWRNLGLRDTWAIAQIAIDPRDPRRVVVAAVGNPYRDSPSRGIYRTTDGGRSWRRTLYLGPSSGASDVAMDPHDPNVVFAGIWQFRRVPWSFSSGGPLDGLFKSTDGGATWRRLRGGGLPGAEMGRIGVRVDGRRVYALIQSKAGILWRSDDGGAHWRLMTRDTLVNQRPFYMSRLAIDPSDPNHVFFSSEDLIETRDGGATYRDVRSAVHQDHHGLWISRDGRRIIEANDGGAPISIDGGKTWDWRFNV
ncbi:MAG: glycosyl hydrolase, partial [Candidatus Eremiobacteraeota bacterium]|nr:glycosyl hydrolase [Candidatus Eremiobacteraeota bacterium]